MELQEPVLKSIVSELRFPPTPRFVEGRADWVESVMAAVGLDSWILNDGFAQINMQSDPRFFLQATPANVSASFESVDVDECRRHSQATIDAAIKAFRPEKSVYVGVRSMWLLPADDFDSLNERLIDELSVGAKPLFEVFGGEPSDSGWVFEFRGNAPEHVFRLGPMKVDQAVKQVFRDKDPANYPDQFLFLDVDRMYNNDADPAESMRRWEQCFDRNLAIAERLSTDLRSRL